jgi:membrane associated rhomboid family serine protease
MARSRGTKLLETFSFGGRVPGGLGLVMSVTLVCSLIVAFSSRHTSPLFEYMALVPREVWRGQVWRLLTWAVIEPDPLQLIFAMLFLWWFGRDLAGVWGSRRFLAVWAGIAGVASVATCIVAQIDRAALDMYFLGGWALSCALTVAWGLWFPERRMLLFFFLPVTGRVMAWGTIVVTVILAVYHGWEHYLPHLFGMAAMLAWIFRGTITSKLRHAKERAQVKSARAVKKKKSVEYLRVVESHDDDDPQTPDIDKKVDEIVRGKRPGKSDLN